MPLYMRAVREECTTPLPLSVAEELQSYFLRRSEAGPPAEQGLVAHVVGPPGQFRAPRFRVMYRAWRQQGDAVLWHAQSSVLKDKFARREARVECVELERQYLHLSSLVGKA